MDVEKLHNEVLRAFNDSCVIATRQYSGRGFRPAADAYFEEDTREIVVRFDLAGMAMSDIELLVDRRELVVRGERTFPTREGRVYQQVEMDYGHFERRVRLMIDVDPGGHDGDVRGRRPRGPAHADRARPGSPQDRHPDRGR